LHLSRHNFILKNYDDSHAKNFTVKYPGASTNYVKHMVLIYFLNVSKLVMEIVTLHSSQLGLYKIVLSFYLEQTVGEISVIRKNYRGTSTNFIKLKKIYFDLILPVLFCSNQACDCSIYMPKNEKQESQLVHIFLNDRQYQLKL
jgi:hypothetical protein